MSHLGAKSWLICVLHHSFNKIQLMLNVESYWMLQLPCSVPFKALGSHLMENPRMCQLMRQHSLLVCWKTGNFTLMGSQFFLKNCSLHASFILSVGPNYSFSAFRVFFCCEFDQQDHTFQWGWSTDSFLEDRFILNLGLTRTERFYLWKDFRLRSFLKYY